MKERLDVLLVKRNLASSREKAKAIIMSGNVFVDGQREDKAGTSFSEEVQIEVRGHALPYVSRGGLKLEKAMKNFDVSMEGKVCTDVGSSTGGFTDCMLQNGAVKVFAIDVGHGQLDWKLRQDERVVCMEKTNIRYVQPEEGNFSKIKIPKDIDCVLTVGGDGTFIQASRRLFGRELPMLGINMGTLGYLTEVEVQNVEEAVKQLVEGNYTIEERMMLYGSAAYRNVRDVALNDIVMTRSGSMKIVHFNLYVNGEFLNSYDADGLIVSTPTGSTAYNLSAGGPIVEPTASLIVVTPICSHALNSRSIVFADKDEIVIEIGAKRENQIEEAVIAYDGADEVTLHTGDRIRIKKAWETAKIVKLSKVSFLETLREKMKGN